MFETREPKMPLSVPKTNTFFTVFETCAVKKIFPLDKRIFFCDLSIFSIRLEFQLLLKHLSD